MNVIELGPGKRQAPLPLAPIAVISNAHSLSENFKGWRSPHWTKSEFIGKSLEALLQVQLPQTRHDVLPGLVDGHLGSGKLKY